MKAKEGYLQQNSRVKTNPTQKEISKCRTKPRKLKPVKKPNTELRMLPNDMIRVKPDAWKEKPSQSRQTPAQADPPNPRL
jgi:hypothetical protein